MTAIQAASRRSSRALEGSLAGLEGVASAFRRELEGVGGGFRDAGREATGMSRSVSASLSRAFEGLAFDGKRLSDTLAGLGRSLSGAVLTKPWPRSRARSGRP
jgi:hypothetical protein